MSCDCGLFLHVTVSIQSSRVVNRLEKERSRVSLSKVGSKSIETLVTLRLRSQETLGGCFNMTPEAENALD